MSPRVALVFPGQGSQFVGMGSGWADHSQRAREVFEEADDCLGLSISSLCWQGPEEALKLTANTQPAILTTAVAIARSIEDLDLAPRYLAGHSLGEYAALVIAGSLEFADALRLVRLRGQFMQEAVPVGVGAMAAILGPTAEELDRILREVVEDDVCTIANLNAPGQTVIAGHSTAVERAVAAARAGGARRAILLPVSAPFHSPLMAPARQRLQPYLEKTPFLSAAVPVVCNIDAKPVVDSDAARDALIRQIDGPVRWVESVEWMTATGGISLFVEVGPGNVLTGLNRRIARDTRSISLSEVDGLEKLEAWLKESS